MQYPVFKPEMKDSYTILVPDMLPVHFKLIINILKNTVIMWNCFRPLQERSWTRD